MSAYEIVMDSRKALVEKVIENMKKGSFLTKERWSRNSLAPFNPISNARYKGGNWLRLTMQVAEKGYQDPRWMTAKQLMEKGYHIRKGEKQTICEKWIFSKDVSYVDANGEKQKESVPLDRPIVRYFGVFNAEQMTDFPPFITEEKEETEIRKIGNQCMAASECKIVECAQPRAFYSPGMDKIALPLHQMFKDDASYVYTALHEMIHSTGHSSRLNRKLDGGFGSESYAREELCAELGAMFLASDLGIPATGEHFEDHSQYLKSWIRVLKEDHNELFRAAADGERAADRIYGNYLKLNKVPQYEREKPEGKNPKCGTPYLSPSL